MSDEVANFTKAGTVPGAVSLTKKQAIKVASSKVAGYQSTNAMT
jgi:hypothetical protein